MPLSENPFGKPYMPQYIPAFVPGGAFFSMIMPLERRRQLSAEPQE